MLVLGRRPGERIFIDTSDGQIVLSIVRIGRNQNVKLGFEGPDHIRIVREEIYSRDPREETTDETDDQRNG